jgi:sugar lactone lactonase YvrE
MTAVQSALAAQPVLAARARLGECPVWDADRQRLYWVDIYNHRVHEFDPGTLADRWFDTGDVVSALVLAQEDRLLLALRDRLAFLHLDSGAVESLQQLEFSLPGTRFNDGKCDPQGRFWIGTMSEQPGQGALYRYDTDGSLHTMETGLTTSNGLGWSPDGASFYLTDSHVREIYAYRFDARSGAISDRRVLINLSGDVPEPDGLTIDRRGHIWTALWNGWAIVHFDADGREIERIKMPVQCPTSLAFGGQKLTDLYVTSASVALSQTDIQRGFQAGDLFCIAGAAEGTPSQAFEAP